MDTEIPPIALRYLRREDKAICDVPFPALEPFSRREGEEGGIAFNDVEVEGVLCHVVNRLAFLYEKIFHWNSFGNVLEWINQLAIVPFSPCSEPQGSATDQSLIRRLRMNLSQILVMASILCMSPSHRTKTKFAVTGARLSRNAVSGLNAKRPMFLSLTVS